MALTQGLSDQTVRRGTLGAVVLSVIAMAVSAIGVQAMARHPRRASAACSSPVATAASFFASVSEAGYVPIGCEPVTESTTAFGGVLVAAYAASYQMVFLNPELPAAVDDHGDAWQIAETSSGARLEQVSPAGKGLFSTSLPTNAGLVAGDSQAIVLKDSNGQYTLFDTVTHQRTAIAPPGFEQAQAGQFNLITSVGVVGDLAILETSQATGNGEGVATQPGQVRIYSADGTPVRAFTLPHRKVAAQPDQPDDSSRIVRYRGVAYLAWNDVPAGNQAGVFAITSSGQVLGSFPVPTAFTHGTGSEALALPDNRLLLSDPSTGTAELVSVQRSGLHTVWRRILYGGAARLGGKYIVTGGSTLRAIRVNNGRVAFTSRLQGYTLEPLVAGPFGVVAEAKSVSRSPQLVLINLAGHMVWRRSLRTGRMFPLPTTVAGNPAIYLGPNLPVLVWR